MTEMDLLIDLHRQNHRQGPGSDAETLLALQLTGIDLHRPIKVADVGCGTGSQTLCLARAINGHITAVDLFPEFLEELNIRAGRAGLHDRISTLPCSMEEMPFDESSLDLIWSEGAIYNIGFEQGVKAWRKFLKPGGYLAVSEITWISDPVPNEIASFWEQEYPQIDHASRKIALLEENGYTLAGYFYLKPESWLTNYYVPLESAFDSFLERHGHTDLARKVTADCTEEKKLYERFKSCYSYGFYIAKRN